MSEKSGQMIAETEWSFFFDARNMEGSSTKIRLSPEPQELHRLSLRLGVVSVDGLQADITVRHQTNDVTYHVKGRLKADITQACVITLVPIKSHIDEEFEAWFADPDGPVSFKRLKHEREVQKAHGETPMLEEKDDPEPLVDGKIDLGELVTQYLSLAINPYPHAEGVLEAHAEPLVVADQDAEVLKNPFAALKDWKARLDKDDN